jgi:hypothetical protein
MNGKGLRRLLCVHRPMAVEKRGRSWEVASEEDSKRQEHFASLQVRRLVPGEHLGVDLFDARAAH